MFSVFKVVPVRLVIAVMMFFACWVNYMTRVGISISIIAMVVQDSDLVSMKSECDAMKNDTNSVYTEVSNLDANWNWRQHENQNTLKWTAQEQAYVLSSYFWGYAISCFIGGMAVEAIGPRMLVFYTTVLCGLGDILSPPAAHVHYMALVALRFVIGFSAGMLFPALHDLLVRWAPPDERGLFISSLMGGTIGTVFTWSLIGPLIDNFGWDIAFYVSGTIVILWCFIWLYLVYDSPITHPRILATEKEYILQAIGDNVNHSVTKRLRPPYKHIFTSFPFLAMIILHYGNSWGFYFVMTAAPKYVSTSLGFNLSSAGILSSLPYFARMTFSLIFGAIGDRIYRTNALSLNFVRKFMCLFSHIIPGILLCSLGYTGCSAALSVAIITFTLGINGAATLTDLVNHVDLAPNFSATLYGIANGIGTIAGFITPLVTAHFTKTGNSFAEWRPVFITGGAVYIGTALYFIVFGSTKIQSWNHIEIPDEEKKPDKDIDSIAIDK